MSKELISVKDDTELFEAIERGQEVRRMREYKRVDTVEVPLEEVEAQQQPK
ncbi:MAG: hypothetical protein ACE5LU_24860 [Anaerolineae bacterium]